MARTYSSFLLRCWDVQSDRSRIEVEHIQTGASTRVASLAEAVAWMMSRWHAATTEELPTTRSEQRPAHPGEDRT